MTLPWCDATIGPCSLCVCVCVWARVHLRVHVGALVPWDETRAIRLPGNNLEGTIPSDMSRLSDMTWLDLSGNHLYGTLPTAGFASMALLGCVRHAGRDLHRARACLCVQVRCGIRNTHHVLC